MGCYRTCLWFLEDRPFLLMQLPSDAIMSKVQLLHSSLWRNLGKFRGQNNKNIWGVPKMMVHDNPWVFPTKNDHFRVFWGYHHLRKHPYHKNHWLTRTQCYSSSSTCKKKVLGWKHRCFFFDSLPLQGSNFSWVSPTSPESSTARRINSTNSWMMGDMFDESIRLNP